MRRIEWCERNIFMGEGEPGVLLYETGEPIRLKVYDGQYVFLNDPALGTDRQGRGTVVLWDRLEHETITDEIKIRELTVEIYDTLNNLIESRKLKYMITKKNYTFIGARDENNKPLDAQFNFVMNYNNNIYFRTRYSSAGMAFPYFNTDKAFFEIIKVVSPDKKYFLISRVDKLVSTPGNHVKQLTPQKEIVVAFDIVYDNVVLNVLKKIPGLSYVADFLLDIKAKVWDVRHVISNYMIEVLGLRGYEVVGVEKVSDYPLIYRVYCRADVSSAVLVAGILVAGIAVAFISMAVRDIFVAYYSVEGQRLISQNYSEYLQTQQKAMEFCKTQADPKKCYNDIVTNIKEPILNTSTAKEAQDSLSKTIEQLKQFLIIAIIGALVIMIVSYLKK